MHDPLIWQLAYIDSEISYIIAKREQSQRGIYGEFTSAEDEQAIPSIEETIRRRLEAR